MGDGREWKEMDVPLRISDAVVPNQYRAAALAMMLISNPVVSPTGESAWFASGPLNYAVKGVDMTTIAGKQFIIEFLRHAAASIAQDLIAQLQAEAQRLADVPPPGGNDAT